MALFDDLSDGVKKVFLAGVGAVAIGAEKTQDLVEDLIKKGELTVEQGKDLNDELTRKVRETTTDASDSILRAKLRGMSADERAEWIDRARKIANDLEAEDVEIEAEEVVDAEAVDAEAEQAEDTEE